MNDYDPKKPSTFISYLDMNNLYGWAMSEYLPYEGFKWLKNVDKFDVMSINEKSPIGYFLEVDLEYPDELHELHNDYPLAPEKIAAQVICCRNIVTKTADKYDLKVGDVKELIPNLGNKTNYVIHYRNLQLYLSLGIKLTKIHRVLKFKQSDWKLMIFKLMINSVYGKTMENLRKRINVRLLNRAEVFLKFTSKPT